MSPTAFDPDAPQDVELGVMTMKGARGGSTSLRADLRERLGHAEAEAAAIAAEQSSPSLGPVVAAAASPPALALPGLDDDGERPRTSSGAAL
jgi:hypothetical protein